MSTECAGIDRSLRLEDGVIEVRSMPFRRLTASIRTSEVASIQLLRKSVMPPAAVGSASILLNVFLRLTGDELLATVPPEVRRLMEISTLGVAVVCLVILLARWSFARLVLRPADTQVIVVNMVPARSAKRFVEAFQRQLSAVTRDPKEGCL